MANFDPKITLILGAGASKEIKMPLGNELRDQIVEMIAPPAGTRSPGRKQTTRDTVLFDAIKRVCSSSDSNVTFHEIDNASRRLHKSLPENRSIDQAIHDLSDPHITLCGKMAIAKAILMAESQSLLRGRHAQDTSVLDRDLGWYRKFASHFFESVKANRIEERLSDLLVISFNYDRSFEHFLMLWFELPPIKRTI